MKKITTFFALTLLIVACSCGNDDNDDNKPEPANTITKRQVIDNYANIVYQSYLDSYNEAVEMKTAIDAFVANPTAEKFSTAKQAWLDAREPYGQTEAYRGANGPIDAESSDAWIIGNEGQMNAWPIEEGLIDYVQANTAANGAGSFDFNSIITNTTITIDESTILDYNEYGENEAAVSTGWHAIEFLLWGQDNTAPADDLPGQRAFTDYTTADYATRRGQYLQVVTNLLVSDLNDLVSTWNTGGTYRTVFNELNEDTALLQLLTGAHFIAGDELSSERMIAPVDSDGGLNGTGQEDEHSCFSDNTHRDIFANAKGVYNVVFGKYGSINGASFYDLVKQVNSTQAEALKTAGDNAMAKVNAIANNTQPFDYLITQETSSDINGTVMQAVVALQNWADVMSASATAIGVSL